MSNTDRSIGKDKDGNGIVYEDLMNLYTLFVDFFRVKPYDKRKEVIVFMNTQDCILTRRSVRKFTDEPVAPETVEQVVSLAAFAPSWKNTQVSRYLAVIEPEDRAQICQYVPDYNARIIDQCSVLLAQTFVKSRSGYERDGSFRPIAARDGSITIAASPHRRCALPHTIWDWERSSWVCSIVRRLSAF